MKTPTKLIIFFTNMFQPILFDNKLISNIINIVGWKVSNFNDKIDNVLNEDI